MSRIKATASAHMRRDVALGRKWICVCDSCKEFRALVGMAKVLEVRPLVREINEIEDQMQAAPDGPELQAHLQRYEAIHDQLAEMMAR
jgi:hypothetical protein